MNGTLAKRKGLAATRTRGLSQAMLGFYPKRAGELLDRVAGVVVGEETYNHTTRPQDLLIYGNFGSIKRYIPSKSSDSGEDGVRLARDSGPRRVG
jgi:hypothetical protein